MVLCSGQVDRLMDLIVNSLYSNREVFLRELVSNASDALDKLRFLSLTDSSVMADEDAMEIRIKADADAKTIVIECVLFSCKDHPSQVLPACAISYTQVLHMCWVGWM